MSAPPETTRSKIIRALAARLQAIRRIDGFATDAGEKLTIGAFFFGPDDDLALALMPGSGRRTGQKQVAKKARLLDLQIGGLVDMADRATAWMRVEELLGDIKRAIETDDDTLGGLLLAPLEDGEELALDSGEGGSVIGASITYTVAYVERWGRP